jgi:hypothetical protein
MSEKMGNFFRNFETKYFEDGGKNRSPKCWKNVPFALCKTRGMSHLPITLESILRQKKKNYENSIFSP